MADKKRCFPFQDFNFPFSPKQNVSQSFIDYGNTSGLNIDLGEENQDLLVHSKHSHGLQKGRQLVAHHPTLPFLEPNERSSLVAEEALHDYQLQDRRTASKTTERSTIHVDNFSTDHPDLMYATTCKLIREELDCFPWKTCGRLRKNESLLSGFKEYFCRFCNAFGRATSDFASDSADVVQHLSIALSDIPPQLLKEYFQESNRLEIQRVHYDTLAGNVLACHPGDQQSLLMYPSGHDLDILNFSHVVSQFPQSLDLSSQGEILPTFNPIVTRQQFANQGRIQQIDCSSYGADRIIVGIRSQYSCSFFQGTIGNEEETMSFSPLETMACTQEAMSIAVSPYIPGEGVVVTKTGAAYLWSCGHALKPMWQARDADFHSSDIQPWYQCIFAANPRCVAVADPKGVDLLDFRAGKLHQRLLFSIPSSQVDSFECVSSIQRHPQNTHHYIVATDQSLMVLDDRFLLHPVLKWRHHNRDPVQFIDVMCDALPDCDDTVLVISGSKHHQTHCFQYSSIRVNEETSTSLTGEKCALPLQSTCLPWKVSSYDDWYYAGLHGNLSFSPVVATRLSKHLIGVCSMPHTSLPQKGFTVLQMSSVGDLFYQSFVAQDKGNILQKDLAGCGYDMTSRESGVSAEVKLSPQAETLCQKWMDSVNNQNDSLQRNARCQFNYLEVNKKQLFEETTSLHHLQPLPTCSLCNVSQAEEFTETDEKSYKNTCQRCDVDVKDSAALMRTRQNKGVATKIHGGIAADLGIFLDPEKAKDPLSRSLWLNWNSDVPIPVVLPGKQVNQNDVSVNQTPQLSLHEVKARPLQGTSRRIANPPEIQAFSSNPPVMPAVIRTNDMADGSLAGNLPLTLQEHSVSQFDSVRSSPKKPKIEKKKTMRVMGF